MIKNVSIDIKKKYPAQTMNDFAGEFIWNAFSPFSISDGSISTTCTSVSSISLFNLYNLKPVSSPYINLSLKSQNRKTFALFLKLNAKFVNYNMQKYKSAILNLVCRNNSPSLTKCLLGSSSKLIRDLGSNVIIILMIRSLCSLCLMASLL